MKLLFDQHISQRVVRSIKTNFPECRHVKYFHLEQASDEVIWDFARQNGYSIVTKDDDFHQRSLLFGHPPKIIWVKLGNSDNATMEDFLRDRSAIMQSFLDDTDGSLLVLRKEILGPLSGYKQRTECVSTQPPERKNA